MKTNQKRKTTKENKPQPTPIDTFPIPKDALKTTEIIHELKMSDNKEIKDPKIIKIPFDDGTKINYHPVSDNQMGVYHANCCIEECKEWSTTVQVTKWVNETGYEIILGGQNGSFQHLSITKEELSLVTKMAKRLDNL